MALSMRRLRLACSAVTLALLVSAAPALAMRGGAVVEVAPSELPLRVEPRVAYRVALPARASAWSSLVADTGDARWRALWDEDTGAPLRVYGGSVRVPGAVASSSIAEAHASAFLAGHLDLIAPSALADDFVVVANELHAGLRTVAFEQRVRVAGVGLVRVPGAIVNVGYKNDRLFVFGSEAARVVALEAPRVGPAVAAKAARAWLLADHAVATTRGTPELVAHRLVRRGREDLRLAYRVEVVSSSLPRAAFEVFVDARSGRPISRASLLRFATEEVLIDAPVRGPDAERMSYPAVFESVTVGATPGSTDANGVITWTDPTATVLGTAPSGQFANVENAAGPPVAGSFPLADGTQALWSLATDEFGDAQLSAYVHMNRVREHALTIAPDMTFLSSVVVGKPNEADPQGCNAFWDGSDLNFYRQNALCNNTARVADVVYHEFGHGFHQHAVIAGAGMIDPALGEGTADFMAVSTTGDPNVAPGFYLGDPTTPLRSVDSGRRWPEDISSDPHETGLIWAGSMWDLRTYLREELGAAAGAALADQLYYGGIQRASTIPTTFVEVLAADDDDGDLGNGTPHLCEIERAFSAHGLADGLDATGLTIAHQPLDIVGGDSYPIEVSVVRSHPECKHGLEIDSVVASVTVNGEAPTDVDLRPVGDRFLAALGALPDGSVFKYHLTAKAGPATIARPDNLADPDYDVFVGKPIPLYCNGFEHGSDGFRFDDGALGPGTFVIGKPEGKGGDPNSAYAGKNVIGTTLGGDGLYQQNAQAYAHSPVVELKGARDVHLQMRRWLTVEDGFYDHATISANGTLLWQNIGTNESDGTLALVDKEWRFIDLDLSAVATDTVQVSIGIDADPLDNFGGWNVDEFCIVKIEEAMATTSSASSGAGGGSSTETGTEPMGCGCEAAGRSPPARWWFGLLTLAAVAKLRRRRA
jgi:MYXO-CTERM domain-containing protein